MKEALDHYLLVHFTGESEEGEQIYFSVSGDGLHFQDLNGGKPVLRSRIGEKGVRDPFILRTREGDRFFIIATDLRIAEGKGWEAAQHSGSRDIIVWESGDLIHWQEERACKVGIEGAGCVWAPEAVYDPQKDAYMVFWASMVKEEGEERGKHRIYCSYTRDFRTFSPPQKYIERRESVIDTTIVYEAGMFYRFSKDETTSTIHLDAGPQLQGAFREIPSETLDHLKGVEGPAAYPLPDGRGWCLIADRFAKGLGYLPLVCGSLREGAFTALPEDEFSMGEGLKRHGSVLTLTKSEYQRLLLEWG